MSTSIIVTLYSTGLSAGSVAEKQVSSSLKVVMMSACVAISGAFAELTDIASAYAVSTPKLAVPITVPVAHEGSNTGQGATGRNGMHVNT
jgi:hypothetical protein